MTKKRFKAKLDECGVYYYVCENGEILAETYGRDDAEDIANRLNELYNENKQLKKDRFICLNCEHSGYIEIGCLCKKKDCWTEYKTECEDYKELKYDW